MHRSSVDLLGRQERPFLIVKRYRWVLVKVYSEFFDKNRTVLLWAEYWAGGFVNFARRWPNGYPLVASF